jgi:lipoprotein signal peptidase
MTTFAAGLLLVPMVDQAIKLLLRRRLGAGSVSLGSLGRVQVVPAQIWLARPWGRPSLATIWIVWLLSAVALTILSVLAPSCAWCAGLLLGGSVSHALETSWRGGICDYVCLRFWPAFNAADLAITAGVLGLAGNALRMMVTT